MAGVYTDVLASRHALDEGDELDYFVPIGFRWIMRNVDGASGSSGGVPTLSVEDLVTGGTILILLVSGVVLESERWEGRQAFNYGGGFKVKAIANSWDYRITGYVFPV
jgi:hypothetical protein